MWAINRVISVFWPGFARSRSQPTFFIDHLRQTFSGLRRHSDFEGPADFSVAGSSPPGRLRTSIHGFSSYPDEAPWYIRRRVSTCGTAAGRGWSHRVRRCRSSMRRKRQPRATTRRGDLAINSRGEAGRICEECRICRRKIQKSSLVGTPGKARSAGRRSNQGLSLCAARYARFSSLP